MMFLKKMFFATFATLVAVSFSAPGAFAADEENPFNGGYVGGAITLDKLGNGATVSPDTATTLDGGKKVAGGLYGGFGATFNRLFYVGLEGGFYLNRKPMAGLAFDTINAGLKSKNTFDLAGRAGFVAGRSLIYGLAGYTSTKFKTFGLASDMGKRLDGLRYGGGVEFAVTPALSLRAEYSRANYKKWAVASGASTITFNPRENRFLLGATLRF
jgi:outer membrane immunogenic protein